MEPKYKIVVTEPMGLIIWDTPRPQSRGAVRRRAEGVGKELQAIDVFLFDGVPYAQLIPLDPQKPEWIRMGEGGSFSITDGKLRQHDGVKAFVRAIAIYGHDNFPEIDLAQAIYALAKAVEKLAEARQ